MKETKVYIGRRNGKHAELMQRLDKALKEQHFAFVFTKQELKEHNRELVKEVCEKIYNDLKPHYGEEINAVVIERVLSNLQKEYEK